MLILASSSPRRQQLLREIGVPFEVREPSFDEDRVFRQYENRTLSIEEVQDLAMRLAREKAQSVAATDHSVLGADTIVTCAGTILAKPADDADAARMLELLSGRDHHVVTGVCLLRSGQQILLRNAVTRVWFHQLSRAVIDDYIRGGEPRDKAGGYGIQGQGGALVESIDGSYSNVVGLPLEVVREMLSDPH